MLIKNTTNVILGEGLCPVLINSLIKPSTSFSYVEAVMWQKMCHIHYVGGKTSMLTNGPNNFTIMWYCKGKAITRESKLSKINE